jgi:hypothetical protein
MLLIGFAARRFSLIVAPTFKDLVRPRRTSAQLVSGDQPMPVLAILALALSLAGCNGDRIKQGMNVPQGSAVKSVSQSAAWSSWG